VISSVSAVWEERERNRKGGYTSIMTEDKTLKREKIGEGKQLNKAEVCEVS
jgi:hypothetical protein